MILRLLILLVALFVGSCALLIGCQGEDEQSGIVNDASATTKPPNADQNINLQNRGEWSVRCRPNPNKQVDPIVSPGVEPSAHNHSPAGGEMTSTADYDSLIAGSTSCHWAAGVDDAPPHSLMWVPVLKRNGDPIPIQTFIVYYRLAKGHIPGKVKPYPDGLQLFAGPQSESPDSRVIVDWGCGGSGGGDYETLAPHNCDPNSANNFLKTRITFPSCSDGRIKSADHRSHLAYPNFSTGCPDSHPIQIPMIQLVVQYQTASASNLKLSSFGMIDIGGQTDPGTKTQHGDYINGWKPFELQQLVDKCVNAQIQCGSQGVPG